MGVTMLVLGQQDDVVCIELQILLIFSTVLHIVTVFCVKEKFKSNKTKLAASRQNLHFNLVCLYLCFGNCANLKPPLKRTDATESLKCDAGVNCVNVPAEAVLCCFFMSLLLYKDFLPVIHIFVLFLTWEQTLFLCDSFQVCWNFFDVTEPFCNSL